MGKILYIIATTTLQSNSGKEYPYDLQLEVDQNTGRTRVTAESACRVFVRPYQLLHLMAKVIMVVNPELIKGKNVSRVVSNPCSQPGRKHLALEYRGKRYRLSHEVGGEWLSNPALLPMLRTLVRLEELDENVFYLASHEVEQYRYLNLSNPHPWEVWIQ